MSNIPISDAQVDEHRLFEYWSYNSTQTFTGELPAVIGVVENGIGVS